MKTLKHILAALCCAVVLSSCDKFLDRSPSNYGDTNTAVQTASDVYYMICGLNRGLTSSSYYGRNMFLYGDAKGGDLTIVTQGRGNDALFTFNHAANSGSYSGFWVAGFDKILQVNYLLESIAKLKASGSVENFDNYEGQLLTTRALVYYDLVRLYGKPYNYDKTSYGVPNITKTLDETAKPGRDKVEDNYNQIVTDLLAATKLSKEKTNGFINHYANRAILARVYMSMEKYSEALVAAEEIINSKLYTLYKNEEWVASWKQQFGTESIFELGVFENEADLGTSSLGAYYCRKGTISSGVLGYFVASSYFISRLGEDKTDVRWGVMGRDEISATRIGACYKYLGGVNLGGDGKSNSTAVNIKMIRLSEIYLIAAEAALMQATPDKAKAIKYLNEIRKRAPGLALATEATVTRQMILDEKSKELYGEGHRFFDMIRTNQEVVFDDATPGLTPPHRPNKIDRTFNKCILPISQDEINANSTIATQQNPGY